MHIYLGYYSKSQNECFSYGFVSSVEFIPLGAPKKTNYFLQKPR